MEPRITVSLNAEGVLEIFLNEKGRERLIQELQKLDHSHEHFHLSVDEWAEVQLRATPYDPSDRSFRMEKSYSVPTSGTGNIIRIFSRERSSVSTHCGY